MFELALLALWLASGYIAGGLFKGFLGGTFDRLEALIATFFLSFGAFAFISVVICCIFMFGEGEGGFSLWSPDEIFDPKKWIIMK